MIDDDAIRRFNRFVDDLLEQLEGVELTRPEDNALVARLTEEVSGLLYDVEVKVHAIINLEEQDFNEQDSKRRYAMYAL